MSVCLGPIFSSRTVRRNARRLGWCALLVASLGALPTSASAQTAAPSSYSAYSGTDAKVPPAAPALGSANTVITDPTFGSRILRVTDQNTASDARSFIPTDAGFHRTWNANSTAIKLEDPTGYGYWLEFNPSTFTVGDGSAHPVPHQLPINYLWEWSAVNPDLIYFLNGNQLASYNKATGTTTNLAGPPNGDPVTSYAVTVGLDNWVCSAAGPGVQDTYTEIFCVNPNQPSNTRFIDVVNRTINGVVQNDPNWPTSAAGQTIGIHSIDGGAGASWLGVSFHQQSWGGNGDAVFNLATNTWSLVTNADYYWSGHNSIGNGKFVNGAGSIDGRDSRGALVRNASDLMNSSQYQFVMQPPTTVNWYDGEHSSWFNSAGNAGAPVLFSRYMSTIPPPVWLPWMDEIIAAATDGSNTVWRFAHTHCCNGAYYTEAFAQISPDGRWALFSSYWDGTLGSSSTGLFQGVSTRIDTFIVQLSNASTPTPPTVAITAPAGGATVSGTTTVTATATASAGVSSVAFKVDGAMVATATAAPYQTAWNTSSAANGSHTLTAIVTDLAGSQATSAPVTVTVSNGSQAPALVVSAVASSVTSSTTATVTWATNVPADSQVQYGPTTGYGLATTLDGTMVTGHSQSLSSLSASTTYHYRVLSRDAGGNLVASPDFTFSTGAASSGTVPVVWTSLVNVTASGSTLTKTGGCDGCQDAGAVSTQTLTSSGGFVQFTVDEMTAERAIGLSNANPGTTIGGIAFGLLLWPSGEVDVRESGVYRTNTTAVVGDTLRVSVAGGTVTYAKNGMVFYTSTQTPTYPLLVDTSFLTAGGTFSNVVLSGTLSNVVNPGGPSPVTWTSLVNVTASGSTLTKTGGCNGCQDAGAVSTQTLTSNGGSMQFTVDEMTAERAIGLSNANPGTTIGGIKFGLLLLPGGEVDVRESGVYRTDTRAGAGDTLQISVVGGKVTYAKNGVVFYTSTQKPTYPLLVDTSFLTAGGTLSNVTVVVK